MYKRMDANEAAWILQVDIPTYDGCFGKGKDGITLAQKTFMHELGINTNGIKYKAQACIIISAAVERRNKGLASLKQIQTISNLKVKTDKPLNQLTKTEAFQVLSEYLPYPGYSSDYQTISEQDS